MDVNIELEVKGINEIEEKNRRLSELIEEAKALAKEIASTKVEVVVSQKE